MKQSLLGVAVILFGLACGESLSPEDIPDIDGTWTVTESVDSQSSSCRFIGTLDVFQDGEHFSGQFSRTTQCVYGDTPGTAAVQSGSIVTGRVGRETVDYRIGDCDYRGILESDKHPARMTGSILCTTLSLSGELLSAGGIWQADRVTE